MKVLSVSGAKGGVSKSTTSIHIAAYFSDFGKTLLVDGDPNHSALSWSQRGHLPFDVVSAQQVVKAVAGKDFVVFDTPARPDTDDLAEIAKGCDLLVLPSTPDIVSILPMLETIKAVGSARYKTLMSIVPPRPNKDGEIAQAELAGAGYAVFKAMIRRSVAFTKAAVSGVTVRDLPDPRLSAAWEDYQALGEEIMEDLK
jgi:chromosome partitioning protein